VLNIAKFYRIVQFLAEDRRKMILTGRERTSATSSMLWDRTQRSFEVHTASVDSAEP